MGWLGAPVRLRVTSIITDHAHRKYIADVYRQAETLSQQAVQ